MQAPVYNELGERGILTQNNSLPRTSLSIQFASAHHWEIRLQFALEPLEPDLEGTCAQRSLSKLEMVQASSLTPAAEKG